MIISVVLRDVTLRIIVEKTNKLLTLHRYVHNEIICPNTRNNAKHAIEDVQKNHAFYQSTEM